MKNTKRALGQYMTPKHVAELMADQVPASSSSAIDLAAGDCSLLRALHERRPDMRFYGFELDAQMFQRAKNLMPNAHLTNNDGLAASTHIHPAVKKGITVLGNPPFTEIRPTLGMQELLLEAFSGLTTKLGRKRSELYFLARSLILAKASEGTAAILMPIGFADGDIYRQYRQMLMTQYAVRRAIEIPGGAFESTEARTILLVIDTSSQGGGDIEIGRYCGVTHVVETVFKGTLPPGERLDARFHEGQARLAPNMPNLQDVGVTIMRGRLSRKEAELMKIEVVHTSDLAQSKSGKLHIRGIMPPLILKATKSDPVLAEVGDILLSRTGSRVSWKPIIVESGARQITDHVFRIRAPKQSKRLVFEAFAHPAFAGWLESVSKGV
jgi:hypothetical protein